MPDIPTYAVRNDETSVADSKKLRLQNKEKRNVHEIPFCENVDIAFAS